VRKKLERAGTEALNRRRAKLRKKVRDEK